MIPYPESEFDKENQNTVRYQNTEQGAARRQPLASVPLNVLVNQVPTPEESIISVDHLSSEPRGTPSRKAKAAPVRVSRRNERERNRVKLINMGFERLRSVVPCHSGEQLSKISTLRKAIWYIEHLDRVLHGQDRSNCGAGDNSRSSASNQSIKQLSTDATAPPRQVYSSTSIDHPARQHSSRSTSQIDMSAKSGKVGAGEAVQMASWSSTDTPLGLNRRVANSGGRPAQTVTTKVPSPIFPTQWGRSTGLELNSTPKLSTLTGATKTGALLQSISAQDSGYASLNSTRTPTDTDKLNWHILNQGCGTKSVIIHSPDWVGSSQSESTAKTTLPFYSWLGKLDT